MDIEKKNEILEIARSWCADPTKGLDKILGLLIDEPDYNHALGRFMEPTIDPKMAANIAAANQFNKLERISDEDIQAFRRENSLVDYTHCSKCGGEKDSEGWCANYCLD